MTEGKKRKQITNNRIKYNITHNNITGKCVQIL